MKSLGTFVLASLGVFAAGLLQAASLVLSSNAAPVMVVPPVVDTKDWNVVYPMRGTSTTVNAGAKYRMGSRIIVAAHAGVITNAASVTTIISTNLSAGVTTNSYTNVASIVVSASGISDYDGTVRWYQAAHSRERLRLAVSIGSDGDACSVILSDAPVGGNTWTYTASGTDDGFVGYQGPLYARKTSTNTCSITAFSW